MAIEKHHIVERLTAIVVEQMGVDPEEVTLDTLLRDDLEMDEVDVIEVVIACEQAFGIEIQEEDEDGLKTIGDLITYLEARAL